MLTGPDADAVLAQHAILPGPRGYTRAQLEAAAAARGWLASAEEIPRATRWTRWRAALSVPIGPGRPPRPPVIARGRGPSREAALAAAMATALARPAAGRAA